MFLKSASFDSRSTGLLGDHANGGRVVAVDRSTNNRAVVV